MLLVTCKVLAVVLCSSWGLTEVMVVHLFIMLVTLMVVVEVLRIVGGGDGGGDHEKGCW